MSTQTLPAIWNKIGTDVTGARDSASVIESSGLNWKVVKQPIQTTTGIEIPGNFATVRSDNGQVLGVVGDRYQVVQNHDAFAFLDSLLQDGIIRYESAGSFYGGRVTWILARMPSIDQIADGDESHRFVLFATSHDGSMANHVLPTSTRIRCMNTLRVAVAKDLGFRHTGDIDAKLNQARLYLSQFDAQFTLFRDRARLLAKTKCTPENAREYIAKLFPEVKEEGRARTIRENKVEQIRSNFRNERNNLPSIKGTWWQMLNAVTESIDHDSLRSAKTNEKLETRMLSNMEGEGSKFKDRAFELALAMAS